MFFFLIPMLSGSVALVGLHHEGLNWTLSALAALLAFRVCRGLLAMMP